MATYCFQCTVCGAQVQSSHRDEAQCACLGALRRDYRAENVGVHTVQLKNEREAGGREGYKDLFLPSNRDFAGPGDPDGTKGMRSWRDTHQPKDTNHRPDWPGTVEKRVM